MRYLITAKRNDFSDFCTWKLLLFCGREIVVQIRANQIYITFMLMVESTRASRSEEVNCRVFITYPRVTCNTAAE